jgi:hypothetical protein
MRTSCLVVCNAGEPDNLIEFVFDDDGELLRLDASAQFRDGDVRMLVERTFSGWYLSTDGDAKWFPTVEEAWAQWPVLLS